MKNYVFAENVMTMVNGALQSVSIKSVNLDGRGVVICYHVELTDGSEANVEGDVKFYQDEQAFKSGSAMEKNYNINFPNLAQPDEDHHNYWFKFFIMENGQPEMITDTVDGFYIDTRWDRDIKHIQLRHYDSSKVYRSREECLAHNDYQVMENGVMVTRKGLAKRMELTDEQKAVMEKYTAVMEELRKANIRCIMDYENYEIGFFNGTDFEECDCNYEAPGDGYEQCDTTYGDWSYNSIPVIIRACDDSFYYKLKK